jgi:hypothetical protein
VRGVNPTTAIHDRSDYNFHAGRKQSEGRRWTLSERQSRMIRPYNARHFGKDIAMKRRAALSAPLIHCYFVLPISFQSSYC